MKRKRRRRERVGHLLITSAPINTASNKEGVLYHQWECGSEKASWYENARDLI